MKLIVRQSEAVIDGVLVDFNVDNFQKISDPSLALRNYRTQQSIYRKICKWSSITSLLSN